MKIKEITLSELCLQSLIRNKDKFQIIANVPYRLIDRYLKRINISVVQLMRYERFNIEWIFDDDELWLEFLRADFPTNVHEKYVNSKDTIVKYYKDAIRKIYHNNNNNQNNNKNDDDENDLLIKIILKNKISESIKRDTNTKKYKVPYRMLYLQYQEDIKLKEAKITENLRLEMQRIKEEREKKSTVIVGEQFYIDNTVGKNRNYRKRYLMDRLSMAGSAKKMSLPKCGTKQMSENRKPIERVAFGGMAGKKIDSKLFRTIYKDPVIDKTNEDNVMKEQESDEHSCMTATVRDSNTTSSTTMSSVNPTSSNKMHHNTSIRKQRNGLEQSIFLRRKRPPSRQNISSSITKSSSVSNISHDKNRIRTNGGNIITNNVSENKDMAMMITGTRRKQSSIFQSPVHPSTAQPYLCDTLKADLKATKVKKSGDANKKTYKMNTRIVDQQDNINESNKSNSEYGKKRKVYSLQSYLQKKK